MTSDRVRTVSAQPVCSPPGRSGLRGAMPERRLHDLRAYLDLLAGDEPPGALFEVRTRRPDRVSMRSWFIDVAARSRLLVLLPAIAERADVYLGVAPRRTDRGTRDAITHGHVAWVDVDGVDGISRLAAFKPAPSMVVASGTPGSAHGYWGLSRPADSAVLEEMNQRLADVLAGDPLWPATTILRPPATMNHKHHPPRPVQLVDRRAARYDPDRLLAALVEQTPGIRVTEARRGVPDRDSGDDRLLTISPIVYGAQLLGVEVPRSGFVTCPWHEDKTPSLKLYETPERGWYCYSSRCRRGGSIYDLAARLWGLSTRDEDFVALRARLLERFPPGR